MVSSSNQNIHSGVMSEQRIIEYLDIALCVFNNKDIDVLVRIAVFHYLFGYIHPFYDGNGRINRFISIYVLTKYMNSLIRYKLSGSIKDNLKDYLDAFKHTNDSRNKADISTFIYEFLKVVHYAYKETINDFMKIDLEYSIYLDKIRGIDLENE